MTGLKVFMSHTVYDLTRLACAVQHHKTMRGDFFGEVNLSSPSGICYDCSCLTSPVRQKSVCCPHHISISASCNGRSSQIGIEYCAKALETLYSLHYNSV